MNLNIGEAKYTIIALSPAIFNVCLISVYRGFYNGINRVDVTAKSQSVEQVLKTVFTIILVEIAFYITSANTIKPIITFFFICHLAIHSIHYLD